MASHQERLLNEAVLSRHMPAQQADHSAIGFLLYFDESLRLRGRFSALKRMYRDREPRPVAQSPPPR